MSTPRTTAVDLIRAAALVGICVVNLPFLAMPSREALALPADGVDQAAYLLVGILFQSKFFLLFSFLFGWGFAAQLGSAARTGADFGARYRRRLLGLLGLGLAHALLVFSGDILVLYALLGCALWPFRNQPPRALVRWALGMIPVSFVSLILLFSLPVGDNTFPEADLGGGYLHATLGRVLVWPSTFGFLVFFQGPLAFGAFLTGLAAAKSGFFEPESEGRKYLRRWAPGLLFGGLGLNVGISVVGVADPVCGALGLLLNPVAAPMLAAGWLHLLLAADQRLKLPRFLTLGGQNSLTAYVMQGVIGGLLFGGHGLGVFGRFGHAILLVLAFVVASASILLTALISRPTGRGPLERLLRAFTRGERA